MDYFTKRPEAYPIPDQEASTVAEALVQHWISRFGVPLQLHSDQGRNFDSAVCKRLCEILAIDKTRTTALHPQSDGMVERFRVLFMRPGYSPSQMLFGRDLRLPAERRCGAYTEITTLKTEGDDVSVHYDPMIAKLVAWGPDRKSALLKLHSALSEYNIVGVKTNVKFLMQLANHKEFSLGNVHTDFIPQYKKEIFTSKEPTHQNVCTALLSAISQEAKQGNLGNCRYFSGTQIKINYRFQNGLFLVTLVKSHVLKINDIIL
ncbi:methylcrotonoyl-CoA carboxylase subunit alpha, mitochondrial [Trichonephila clavipes]|uniref:Methylcrotonoyl-CoA carboxylase subunit alpha, mitochondrial n=1 Tax=Trichonephila clavipes TaxID=2585209 RepID=A0A8X6SNY3_TRICX|nr:methylcrotonoyl-CoA carboxylase subunit alpha, mitochondrial [Trichonephila clavipes]